MTHDTTDDGRRNESFDHVSGVFPELSLTAQSGQPRSEGASGAMMAWADRLWVISYVSVPGWGDGTGLYEIDTDLSMTKRPESVVGTYANRMIHHESDQLIIGPHAIDTDRNVRTFDDLRPGVNDRNHRLTATMAHLENPDEMVYFLTMAGLLYEANVHTLEVNFIADLMEEIPLRSHAKGGFTTTDGHVVVTANEFYGEDHENPGTRNAGLAEWDGKEWKIIRNRPFMDVNGTREALGGTVFATGWDEKSATLAVREEGAWTTYRLPKASHAYDHGWFGEWTRIREVEHERYLLDCHGMFYELMPVPYDGAIWGVRPVSTHLRVVPDFCSFAGLLVLGGDQVTQIQDTNPTSGQPQSGLWFGKTDDLWQFGDPKGWGAVWKHDEVAAGEPSDPYLMTGFDGKTLHLFHEHNRTISFDIQVDFLGGFEWNTHRTIRVAPNECIDYQFPTGFGAHWVRLVASDDCEATAHFTYT